MRLRAAACTVRTGWRQTLLLDGLVFGARVVAAIERGKRGPDPSGAMAELLVSGMSVAARTGSCPSRSARGPREPIQGTMSTDVGVVRDADGLGLAAKSLGALLDGAGAVPRSVAAYEVANLVAGGAAIVAGATARLESRGSHARADFPTKDDAQRGRYVQLGGEPPSFVALRGTEESPS